MTKRSGIGFSVCGIMILLTALLLPKQFNAQADVIGDFVWYDSNHDGIQDPGEPGLNGVQVELWIPLGGGAIQIGTTVTDVDGIYNFDDTNVAGGFHPFANGNTYYIVIRDDILEPGTDQPACPTLMDVGDPNTDSDGSLAPAPLPFEGRTYFEYTIAGFATIDFIDFGFYNKCLDLDVNIPPYVLACEGETVRVTAEVTGGNPDFGYAWSEGTNGPENFVDIRVFTSDFYQVTVTDNVGCTATDEVFIEVERCRTDLSLSKVNDDNFALLAGEQSNFTLTVCNEGETVVDSFVLFDYYRPGYILDDTDWTQVATNPTFNTAQISYSTTDGELPPQGLLPTECIEIPITFEIDACANNSNLLNEALIIFLRDEYGFQDDFDSTPSADVLGEDDEDSAIAPVFDLALRKVITSGPGPYYINDIASFDIEIINQGSMDASDIVVLDHLPSGLEFIAGPSNPNWIHNVSDNTLTYNYPGSLAPGASDIIPLNLSITNSVDGSSSWTNIAEIIAAEDINENSMIGFDIDSQYDTDPTNDVGGTPNSNEDDHIDDNGQNKDGDAITDEDDHDPAMIPIFDLALTKENITAPPHFYGQDVSFLITVCNQGNVVAQQVEVMDYVPPGFSYDATNNSDPWTPVGANAFTILMGQIGADECQTVTITLTMEQTTGDPKDWINYAEIMSAQDNTGADATNNDLDSNPLSNTPEENLVLPGDPDDNNISGGGPSLGEDEDDHDPAGIAVYDIALTKRVLTPGPYGFGDMVTFEIELFNQGNQTLTDILVVDYVPSGMWFAPGNFPTWSYDSGSNTAAAEVLSLDPGTSTTITIDLRIISASNDMTAWTNRAEVSQILDATGVDVSLQEIDSNIDAIVGNDVGGAPGTNEDDHIDDDGTDSDGDGIRDEDDEDPALIPVFDLALTKELATNPPYAYDDLLIFNITVTNQGNVRATGIEITDYVPSGYNFDPNLNPIWSPAMTYTHPVHLNPSDSFTVPILLTLEQACGEGVWVNYAEITAANDPDGPATDVDSEYASNNAYENLVNPGDPFDNEILGNGEANDEDEDDHDPAGLNIFDLALRKTTVTSGSRYGDIVEFQIEVFNQGSEVVREVDVIDYIPDGMEYFSSNAPTWDHTVGTNVATTQIAQIDPCDSHIVNISFRLIKATTPADDWVNHAEIYGFKDIDLNSVSEQDIDSTPDLNNTNDNSINDEIDEQDNVDEDDHDLERIEIYDLALSKEITTQEPAGGFNYNDVIIYEFTVCNQGNTDVTDITIEDYVPNGLTFAAGGGWNASAQYTINNLNADECTTFTLDLTLTKTQGGSNHWINYAEIISYRDASNQIQSTDADSNHGSNSPYENQVTEDHPFNNEMNGCGESVNEDEDDHDVAGLTIYDLALRKTNSDVGPFSYGDPVTFTIEVFNQGNQAVRNVVVNDYIPTGMELLSGSNSDWNIVGNTSLAATTIDAIAPGSSETVTITLVLIKSLEAGDDWINMAEINSFSNATLDIVSDQDIDSTPDNIADNDSGTGVGTADDNEINECGFDANPAEDEDDHDAERIAIYDLALNKTILSPEPVGGFNYNDVITFQFNVCNQGNSAVTDVVIADYLPTGLQFTPGNGWDANAEFTISTLDPDECVQVDLDLTLVKSQGGPNHYINYGEILRYTDSNNVVRTNDADSNHGSNSAYENEVTEDHPFNDDMEGCGANVDEDEDDHDVAGLKIVDLALTKTTSQSGPFMIGDPVSYTITVYNQGNMPVADVGIIDYIPDGLNFAFSNFPTWFTDPSGSAAIASLKDLEPGTSQTLDITLTVGKSNEGEFAWDNIAEIYYMEDDNWSDLDDIDSVHDTVNDNDAGGQINTPDDNEINGCGYDADPDEDEDDHDPERIEVFDLALIKTIETPAPYSYCQDVTFNITVCNQGNEAATDINIVDYTPSGLLFNSDNNPDWNGGFFQSTYEIQGPLEPGDCISVPIVLTINNTNGGYDLWTNFAEILSASNSAGQDRTNFDIDSTPGSNAPHETSVEVGGPDDDNLDGCGPSVGEDEDDHDPAGLPIFDLALRKSIPTPGPYEFGDTICYLITVFNQGNIDARNIDIIDYIPVGLDLVSGNFPTWSYNEIDNEAITRIMGPLTPGSNETVEICFEILPLKDNEEAWDNRAEIYAFKDGDFNTLDDIDSTPDDIVGNDVGGRPWTLEDNHIQDDGTDCNNTNIPLCRFDEIGIIDEDDEDVARIEIPDLALRKTLVECPTDYGQIAEFTIEIFNQGNEDANNIDITDYIPNGYQFVDFLNNPNGWSLLGNGDARITIDGPLEPETSIQIPIFLRFVRTNGGEKDWINYAEITHFEGRECSFPDGGTPFDDRDDWEMDSDPGSNSQWENNVEIPPYDQGVEPDFPWDDEICGRGQAFGEDEDDHDPAGKEIFDLALRKLNFDSPPYRYGDQVTFFLQVHNQGSIIAENVELTDYLPCGYEFDSSLNDNWNVNNATGNLNYIIDELIPGQIINVPLTLIVIPCIPDSDIAWINCAEISDAEAYNDPDPVDFDSTFDDLNNETLVINNASQAPTNSDEDDHDCENIEILDFALRKIAIDCGPFAPGDTVDFEITVFNQGNQISGPITISDSINSGFIYDNTLNTLWSPLVTDNKVTSILPGGIAPKDSFKRIIRLVITQDSDPFRSDWYNYAEISSSTNNSFNITVDADSNADDNFSNDNPVQPSIPTLGIFDPNDDVIDENFPVYGDPAAGNDDEDDSDPAKVLVVGGVGDFVWKDEDGDGLQGINEPGIPNIPVRLQTCDGQTVAVEVTDSEGFYFFNNVEQGFYQLSFDITGLDEGCDFTFQNVGDDDTIDSDPDEFGLISCFEILAGSYDSTYDAGLLILPQVGDFVWHDLDGDGLQDFGEPGIPGVIVNLYDEFQNFIKSDTTDANGFYLIENFYPGDYYLEFEMPDGFTDFTLPNVGFNDLIDSDVNHSNGPGTTDVRYFGPGARERHIDAGLYKCVSIGDLVWYDINRNNLADPTENGINGVIVKLFRIDNGVSTFIESQFTGADPNSPSGDGYFKFCVRPGRYYIEVITPQEGLVLVAPNRGDEEIDSDITHANGPNTTEDQLLISGQDWCTIGAGYYPQAQVGDRVWRDDNGDGIQSHVEPPLYNTKVEAINAEGDIVKTVYSDHNGFYNIGYLNEDNYYFRFTPNGSLLPTDPHMGADDNMDSDVDDSYGPNTTRMYNINSGDSLTQIDAGFVFGVLPVEWQDISVTRKNATHVLAWSTLSEINNSHFEIERLRGQDQGFIALGKVSANDSGESIKSYQWVDSDISVFGEYLYRVKQVDLDGNYTYSEIVSIIVNKEIKEAVNIYPIPANGELNIELYDPSMKIKQAEILNAKGQVVQRLDLNKDQVDYYQKLDISHLTSGKYTIIFISSDAQVVSEKKFIVIR